MSYILYLNKPYETKLKCQMELNFTKQSITSAKHCSKEKHIPAKTTKDHFEQEQLGRIFRTDGYTLCLSIVCT